MFFCSGGSEAVESAWKLARQYYVASGQSNFRSVVTPVARAGVQEPEVEHDAIVAAAKARPRRYKAIARHIAYHGTTLGALSLNGIPAIRTPFEPLVSEVRHVRNTNRYHRPPEETEEEFTALLLEDLETTILAMGPETVCLVHMEPVQNAGGCFTPPEGYWRGVRDLCTEYDILLSADEVITGFGRLGYWFGSERYDIRPDLVTCAKGLSSSYAAIGGVVATDRVMEPFLEDTSMFSHGITFGGHPVMCAIALKNIEIMKRERIVEGVREHEARFRSTLEQLLDLPIVGDVRGAGFLYAIELVRDKDTRTTFSDDECEWLLRGFLSRALYERGLICRADDRGDPVIQISPPLVARQEEFDRIVAVLGETLAEAWKELGQMRAAIEALPPTGRSPRRPAREGSEDRRDRVRLERRHRRRLDGARLQPRRLARVRRDRGRLPGAGGAAGRVRPDVPDRGLVLLDEPGRPGLRDDVHVGDEGDRAAIRLDRRLGAPARRHPRDGEPLPDRRPVHVPPLRRRPSREQHVLGDRRRRALDRRDDAGSATSASSSRPRRSGSCSARRSSRSRCSW